MDVLDAFQGIGMDVYRAEKLAQEHGPTSCRMTCLNSKGHLLKGTWLDADMGCFKPDSHSKFLLTKDLAEAGFRCLLLTTAEGEPIGRD